MKHLQTKRYALTLFIAFAIVYIGMAFITGTSVKDIWAALRLAYKSIPVLLLVVALFVSYAWRWRIFKGWLVPFPDLNGTWQGHIQTTWKNPETGEVPGPIPAILTIRQTFTRMSCVMRTAEMVSHSYLADFWLDREEQVRRIGYSYLSKTAASVQKRSPVHEGSALLEVIGDPVERLSGQYWNARNQTGDIVMTFREKKMLEVFPSDLGRHPVSGK